MTGSGSFMAAAPVTRESCLASSQLLSTIAWRGEQLPRESQEPR